MSADVDLDHVTIRSGGFTAVESVSHKTLTTVLASRVRQGMTPAISALAVIIIAITVTGAIIYEIVKSAEMRREAKLRTAG